MGPQARELHYPMKTVHWAIMEGASSIPEWAVRWDFLCEQSPFLDSLEECATFRPLPRFYGQSCNSYNL